MTFLDGTVLQLLVWGPIFLLFGGTMAAFAWRGAAVMNEKPAFVPKDRIRVAVMRAAAVAAALSGLLIAAAFLGHLVLYPRGSGRTSTFAIRAFAAAFFYPYCGLSLSVMLAIFTIGDWAKPTFRSFAAGWWAEARTRALWRRLRRRGSRVARVQCR